MVLGVARKKVRFARPTECTSIFGYAPGTVPPFAHDVPARVLLDTALEGAERIVLGGGTSDVLLEASFEALLELCHAPRVLPLAMQHDITSLQAAPQD
ncbi:hypothetical protein SPRG_03203 [Saprolegnia parasitica CBS 223.65]|uniref:YbaK/aminoacyl-tRNA synthetase-associated domain-containing protein n=1 Tax=Saprolegnia parasitica (strain CBS 223.65) TaxID=695850 RepID=A0A067CZM7_SAPPC|nr:hypothetical protein SPRG_03203 [Saprolegnia parasitica CBS 223.65]KDO31986.1 hypothetical protein SPRG_03203 [Saprolegnia parasitica CBS 223.65]|eukprot:XP_012197182.1 hypothetical protein SPRG_03203 [Saprolegnia parasitica CBS 223.65]